MAAELSEKLLEIHRALRDAGVSHAFGGAIALAYWTRDPRGTSDIDVNIFVSADQCEAALAVLPDGVAYDRRSIAAIKRDGQCRLHWGDVPVDVFFNNVPLHDRVAEHTATVPFGGEEIPILGPVELAIFKAMFNRFRDWGDIESMVAAQTLDTDALRDWLLGAVGPADERVGRLDRVVIRDRLAG